MGERSRVVCVPGLKSSSAALAARRLDMASHRELNRALFVALDPSNTARVTLNNPRNGHLQCVDVYAHPQDIAHAVIMFARNQGIRPTEVEMSTVWPAGSDLRHSTHAAQNHRCAFV